MVFSSVNLTRVTIGGGLVSLCTVTSETSLDPLSWGPVFLPYSVDSSPKTNPPVSH